MSGLAGRRLTRARKWAVGAATLVLMVGLANLARGGLAIASAVRLPGLPMTVRWEYLAASGILWGLVLTVCAFCLVGFCRWARLATLGASTLYQVHVWVNHLLYDANDYARGTWPRDLVISGLFLAIIWGVLSWPSVRREFGDP